MPSSPQKLNINAFMANGKNYRQEDRLDLEMVTSFIESEWYRVTRIFQPWRYVCAYIEREGQACFLKMASTEWVGERLYNEITWNNNMTRVVEARSWDLVQWLYNEVTWSKNINHMLSEYPEADFIVPRILSEWVWQGLPYYIAEAFHGELVVEKWKELPVDVELWLDRIVSINHFLLSLDRYDLDFYRDHEHSSDEERLEALIARILSWSVQIPERDLKPLEEMIHAVRGKIITGVSHGDFVPWNMIREGDRIVLIDGEHGSAKTPRYYDVAYLYHRLYTLVGRPDLADRYLRAVVSGFDSDELTRFHDFFPHVLASRTIGGYFDAKNDGTDFDIHDRLRTEVLAGRFQTF